MGQLLVFCIANLLLTGFIQKGFIHGSLWNQRPVVLYLLPLESVHTHIFPFSVLKKYLLLSKKWVSCQQFYFWDKKFVWKEQDISFCMVCYIHMSVNSKVTRCHYLVNSLKLKFDLERMENWQGTILNQFQMNKENLIEQGFEPQTSGLMYQHFHHWPKSPYWQFSKLLTVFAWGGVPVRTHKPRNASGKNAGTSNQGSRIRTPVQSNFCCSSEIDLKLYLVCFLFCLSHELM